MSAAGDVRVVMATARFWPEVGGVETHCRELGARLVRSGVAVEIVATDRGRSLVATDRVDGMTIRRLAAYPRNFDLYFSPELPRHVANSRADLVHVQGIHTLVAPLAMMAARSARIPYVVTLHSGGHSSRARTMLRPVQYRLLRPLIRGARAVICGSVWEATELGRRLGLSRQRIEVIPSGVELPGLDAAEQRQPGLIVSVGRLERYKGHERVIDALPSIHSRHPDARLRILGDGPEYRNLWRRADALGVGSLVEIGPALGRLQVASVLARASVVVSLSEYESQGLAVWEAVALGSPVVVTAGTALSELVQVGAAHGVRPGATSAEVAKVLLGAMHERPANRVIAVPTWDACTQAVMEVYRRVLSTGRPNTQ